MNEMLSPIAVAVEPLRTAAIERAKKYAGDYARKLLARLAEDQSLGRYPRNTGSMSRAEYLQRKAVYSNIVSLTDQVGNSLLNTDVRVSNEKKIEQFVERAGTDASQQYDAFVAKLESKIGECDSVVLDGDHVWSYSTLTVTKGSIVERWTTHQIINVSKLGKVFNQWPTRKAK